MRRLKMFSCKLLDILIVPLIVLGALVLKLVRKHKKAFAISWYFLRKMEVIPVINHYYEPLISKKQCLGKLHNRRIEEINFNEELQMQLLDRFHYNNELIQIPYDTDQSSSFYYHNGSFGPGDAEFLYSIIRTYRPRRLIEIGCGNSTKIAIQAIQKNNEENSGYSCKITCIEPYEQPWLEGIKEIQVIRERVENVALDIFETLQEGDILFIDSSHVIRPQGDVLWEYQRILPRLNKGVLIHIHDIFTPNDYPEKWVFDEVRLWNEQYLLESFLMYNKSFEIIGALNFLKHFYWDKVIEKCPVLKTFEDYEPGSFWIRKV